MFPGKGDPDSSRSDCYSKKYCIYYFILIVLNYEIMFQTNFELRRLARKKGPSEEEFTRLANSVDQFTSCLLDPLKSHTEARHAFGDSLDDVMDAGIEWEQKKVLKPFCRLDSI